MRNARQKGMPRLAPRDKAIALHQYKHVTSRTSSGAGLVVLGDMGEIQKGHTETEPPNGGMSSASDAWER